MSTTVASTSPRLAIVIACALLAAACSAPPEQRPGTVETIGGSGVSASVSGVQPALPQPTPATAPAVQATKGDGVYTPGSNVAIYQLVSLDLAEIASLTNQVNEGKPMPVEEIKTIYEQAKHAKIGDSAKPLKGFAAGADRAKEFPEDAAFYGSPTFLDDWVSAAINGTAGTGPIASYSDVERRQAIQKGNQRIIRYWVVRYWLQAETKLKAGDVTADTGAPHSLDEGWAMYVGAENDGKYPYSISATALSREGNFGREGTVDAPLREAFERGRRAALNNDVTGFEQAKNAAFSRLNALFYLASARYLSTSLEKAQASDIDGALVQLAEGYAFYLSIQPQVAKADPEADKTIVRYYTSSPSALTAEKRDAALAALNKAAGTLLLKPADLLTPADYK